MRNIPEFNALDSCCRNDEQETLEDGALVDTYGGDYTYQYRYRCTTCGRIWSYCTGTKAEDAEYEPSEE